MCGTWFGLRKNIPALLQLCGYKWRQRIDAPVQLRQHLTRVVGGADVTEHGEVPVANEGVDATMQVAAVVQAGGGGNNISDGFVNAHVHRVCLSSDAGHSCVFVAAVDQPAGRIVAEDGIVMLGLGDRGAVANEVRPEFGIGE